MMPSCIILIFIDASVTDILREERKTFPVLWHPAFYLWQHEGPPFDHPSTAVNFRTYFRKVSSVPSLNNHVISFR